ncbi:hypothetical protein P376_5208 [Streptomyces sp. HCCB10043]|nr:hypothetical protein P376_5208 [Streptomyces sp. HCCB10043]
MRLDGLAALRQLLVEPLPALDGLGVQLGLEARLVLGVLLEDPLGLGAGLAQLALGVAAHLLGLDLRVPQHLLGLVADVRAVVGGTGGEIAPGLVQLGTQDLDLVTEVLGVLDGLLPVGLQPVHLGFEPREMVVFSSVALLAFVAPHCAVPSFPELSTSASRGDPNPGRNSAHGGSPTSGPPGNGDRQTTRTRYGPDPAPARNRPLYRAGYAAVSGPPGS